MGRPEQWPHFKNRRTCLSTARGGQASGTGTFCSQLSEGLCQLVGRPATISQVYRHCGQRQVCRTSSGCAVVFLGGALELTQDFSGGSDSKASAYNAGDLGSIPGSGRCPGEGNGYPLQYLAWKIPWSEQPDGLQSLGSQRVDCDLATERALTHPERSNLVKYTVQSRI